MEREEETSRKIQEELAIQAEEIANKKLEELRIEETRLQKKRDELRVEEEAANIRKLELIKEEEKRLSEARAQIDEQLLREEREGEFRRQQNEWRKEQERREKELDDIARRYEINITTQNIDKDNSNNEMSAIPIDKIADMVPTYNGEPAVLTLF